MPSVGFKDKWFFMEGLPLAAMALFLFFHLLLVCARYPDACLGRKGGV
jgi:hypothetical protein